jgi:hypothetical protein
MLNNSFIAKSNNLIKIKGHVFTTELIILINLWGGKIKCQRYALPKWLGQQAELPK